MKPESGAESNCLHGLPAEGAETEHAMSESPSLGEGIELVKEGIFWPEGQWSIRKGEMVWSKVDGWRRYYEADENCRFSTAKDALGAWENSKA